jgi:hypothetical protein
MVNFYHMMVRQFLGDLYLTKNLTSLFLPHDCWQQVVCEG